MKFWALNGFRPRPDFPPEIPFPSPYPDWLVTGRHKWRGERHRHEITRNPRYHLRSQLEYEGGICEACGCEVIAGNSSFAYRGDDALLAAYREAGILNENRNPPPNSMWRDHDGLTVCGRCSPLGWKKLSESYERDSGQPWPWVDSQGRPKPAP